MSQPSSQPSDVIVMTSLEMEGAALCSMLAHRREVQGGRMTVVEGELDDVRLAVVRSPTVVSKIPDICHSLVAAYRPRAFIAAGLSMSLAPMESVGAIVKQGSVSMQDCETIVSDDLFLGLDVPFASTNSVTLDRWPKSVERRDAVREAADAMTADLQSYPIARFCRDRKMDFLGLRTVALTYDHELTKEYNAVFSDSSAYNAGVTIGAFLSKHGKVTTLRKYREGLRECADELGTQIRSVLEQAFQEPFRVSD